MERREVLEEVAAGRVKFAVALGDAAAARLTMVELLEAMPGLGPSRTARVLERAGVAPWLEAREVTPAQLDRLASEGKRFSEAAPHFEVPDAFGEWRAPEG